MYKVMVADGDKTFRSVLKSMESWRSYGFLIKDEAYDGKEALKKLNENDIDLVVTDVKMPVMDGIEFLKEVRKIKLDICVIFLSGHIDFEYARQGIRLGVFDYLKKPVDEKMLGDALERAKTYLDTKNRLTTNNEEEKNILSDLGYIYYPSSREKKMTELLMSGNPELLTEAEETYNDITCVIDDDPVKTGILLEAVLMKLLDSISRLYPWLGKIEKTRFGGIKESETIGEMKLGFLSYIKHMLEVIVKYNLNEKDSIVRKTCEYVLNHVEEDIKLEKIANELFVRSDYIGKLFKKKTGITLTDYATKIKMEHAKYLLGTGKMKNYEISERLGYSTPDYFRRLFRQCTGCTPSEFRKAFAAFCDHEN